MNSGPQCFNHSGSTIASGTISISWPVSSATTGLLAQLGDLLHHDSHLSVTPTHAHVLDADSRLQKVIRVVIKTLRRIVRMMLQKYEHVHMIMADANHDPAGEAWLREMFAAFFEDEPRLTVDRSASTYYAYEFGDVSLFYHHGHKRKPSEVDSVSRVVSARSMGAPSSPMPISVIGTRTRCCPAT